jgi:serine/threonine protein kinase
MAPEVVKQTSYTRKADIWSLGCLVVEMFTGSHPFPDFSQMQAIFKVFTKFLFLVLTGRLEHRVLQIFQNKVPMMPRIF